MFIYMLRISLAPMKNKVEVSLERRKKKQQTLSTSPIYGTGRLDSVLLESQAHTVILPC